MVKSKICFIDKDGVINRLVNHQGKKTAPWKLSEVVYYSDVQESIDKIKQMGFIVCVVTNQPDFDVVNETVDHNLDSILIDVQKRFSIDYLITNHVRGTNYYKPNSQCLQTLITSFDSDKDNCYFLGDTWKDIVAAHNAGIDSVYILRENQEYDMGPQYRVQPTYTASGLLDAVLLINEIELLKGMAL